MIVLIEEKVHISLMYKNINIILVQQILIMFTYIHLHLTQKNINHLEPAISQELITQL